MEFPQQKEIILNHSWYYIDTGQTKKRMTIVFIHGTTGSAEIFWQQIQTLSSDYRVISITIPAIIGIEKLCKGLLELFHRIDISEMVLLGTSFGGYVSQAFAPNNQEMIKGLILGNTFNQKLDNLPYEIIVYEPSSVIDEVMKKERVRLTEARAMLLYMLYQLVKNGEFVSEFSSEKICYFVLSCISCITYSGYSN